jgi:hypothetical protein
MTVKRVREFGGKTLGGGTFLRRNFWLANVLLATTACSTGLTPGRTPAHGVDVVATVIRRVASGDTVTIRITNAGDQDAFLSRCGSGPLVLAQKFIGTQWTGGVQNILCLVPTAPGPIRLGPTESLTVMRVFIDAGRYRFLVPVASTQGETDVTQAVSNEFDVP